MSVFRLMRFIHETPDYITQEIANVIGQRERGSGKKGNYSIAVGPDPTFFMKFWNMKQSGELPADEMPAVWAVLMRAIDARVVVTFVMRHCIGNVPFDNNPRQEMSGEPALRALVRLSDEYIHMGTDPSVMTAQYVSKFRAKLVNALREAATVFEVVKVLDPVDAYTLLSACEIAITQGEEEKRRWAMALR